MVMDSDGLVLPPELMALTNLLLEAFPELNGRYTIPHAGLVLADVVQSGLEGHTPPPCSVRGADFGDRHQARPHLDKLR